MNRSDATKRIRTLAAHPVCAALGALPAASDVAVVGGTLRDLLLDRPHPDLDLCVAGDPRAVAAALRQALGGSWFVLDEKFGIVRFTGSDGGVVDLARRQGGSWEEDLRRRDLTINALGAVLIEGGRATSDLEILDPTGGLADLRQGIVRATSLEALEADPLRALRVYRFAAALGFQIERATRRWAAAMGERLKDVSWERIRDEIFKLLAVPSCGPYVAGLADAGLLERVFPELSWLRGTVSTGHFDGFVHRIESNLALDRLLSARAPWSEDERRFLVRYFEESISGGRTRLALGRAALLTHGLEAFRPQVPRTEPPGEMRDHRPGRVRDDRLRERRAEEASGEGSGERTGERAGEMPAGRSEGSEGRPEGPLVRFRRGSVLEGICSRLRLANAEARYLAAAERGMVAFADLCAARRLSGGALYRFFREAGPAAPAVALLGLAEYQAARDLTLEDDEGVLGLARALLAEAAEPTVTAIREPLVRGDELMAALGLEPGPRVARLLEAIAEARAEGLVDSADEAIAFARASLAGTPIPEM